MRSIQQNIFSLFLLFRHVVMELIYLKGINFRKNLFSQMNFFDISRELIFANAQILEISREQIFANVAISNDQIFFFFNFFSIKKDIKCIRMEKIKTLIFVNTTCPFTSYQTEITSFIIVL